MTFRRLFASRQQYCQNEIQLACDESIEMGFYSFPHSSCKFFFRIAQTTTHLCEAPRVEATEHLLQIDDSSSVVLVVSFGTWIFSLTLNAPSSTPHIFRLAEYTLAHLHSKRVSDKRQYEAHIHVFKLLVHFLLFFS